MLIFRSIRAVHFASTLLIVLGLGASVLSGCQRGKSESSIEPLRRLDRSFQPIRREFEESTGKVRLVLVVAPTCGNCLSAAEEIHDLLLARVKSEDLAVFVIWNSIAPTDVLPRARRAAQKWADPRALHYWDESGRISRAFGRMLGLETGKNAYDCYFLYDGDATWDPDGKMAEEAEEFDVFLAGWQPTPAAYRWTNGSNLRLPAFKVDAVEDKVEELLARSAGAP